MDKTEQPRIIKKYLNRRLYDTITRRYITLDEIKEIVLSYTPFQVIDVKTKKDVTQAVLLQIIYEQETEASPIFTTQILQNMIRFYGNPLQKNLSRFLEQSFSFLAQSPENLSENFQNQIKAWIHQNSDTLNPSTAARQSVILWQSFFEQLIHSNPENK